MNKILFSFCILCCNISAFAQTGGLEQIIVEKYYVSDANDSKVDGTGGTLPVGSTTYRIYVDMLPGYIFQAAYGVPEHELRIATTTTFFNNEDRGAPTPKYSKTQAKGNTVMLDSWLSVGAACSTCFGVLKSEDDGVATLVNKDGVLQNNDGAAGIPLTVQDGLLDGTPEDATTVGLDLSIFDDATSGGVFSDWDGSWASLNGSIGPDTVKNKVLIAQMTTDGKFSFELNIQLRSPNFEVERYVARNPVGDEKTHETLIYPFIVSSDNPNGNNQAHVNVYPNPVNDLLKLEVKNVKNSLNNYSIYDSKGTILANEKINASSTTYNQAIDISKYSGGLYFVVLSVDGTMVSRKFVKN